MKSPESILLDVRFVVSVEGSMCYLRRGGGGVSYCDELMFTYAICDKSEISVLISL